MAFALFAKDARILLGMPAYLGSMAIAFLWLFGDDKHLSQPAILQGHEFWVQSVAFAPDGKTLASAGGLHGKAGEVILWDVSTRTERMRLPQVVDLVSCVRFSPDGA